MPKEDIAQQSQPPSFKNWIEVVGLLLGLFVTFFGIISQLNTDTNTMRYLAIAGYVVFFIVLVWISFVKKDAHPLLKTAGLIAFFVLTPLFFIWVGTWIVKAPLDLNNHPIERDTFTIYDYSGQGSPPGTGAGYVAISNSFFLNRPITKYAFDYTMPQKDSYAGFVIHFDPPVDITAYQKLRFTIKFKESKARVKLTLRDSAKNAFSILLGEGQYGTANNPQEQVLEIPLDNFQNVVRLLTQEIEFSANGTFDSAPNGVIISNISFTR
jgi:hypothetical protein